MLSRFPNKTLKIGAKVSLSPETEWSNSFADPRGIVGVVDGIYPETELEFRVGVQWSNDTHNAYRMNDYDLIAEGEPGFLSTR